MFNIIKMDIYRIFKTKSFYVISIIIAFVLLFTTFISKLTMEIYEEYSEIMEENASDDGMNVGISVNPLPDEGGVITLSKDFYANASGMVLALFFVIFTVIFSTADYTSGYLKNIAGQVKHKEMIVISKAVSLFVYTIISVAWFILMQAVSHLIVYGSVHLGDAGDFITYILMQIILNYALMIIVMTLSAIFRNNLISMIIAVCLCMNIMSLIYFGIDKIISKIGIKDFSISNYTVTGKISELVLGASSKEVISALVISLVFIAAGLFINSTVFRKRDII